MKIQEIIQILEFKGHDVRYGKYQYWDNVPYVVHDDGTRTWIVKRVRALNNSLTIDNNLAWYKVEKALREKCSDINEAEAILQEEKIEKIVKEEMEEKQRNKPMPSDWIIEQLEKDGYQIKHGNYEYYQNVPYVLHKDGSKTFLIETDRRFGILEINKNLIYNEVVKAIKEKRQVVKELLPL